APGRSRKRYHGDLRGSTARARHGAKNLSRSLAPELLGPRPRVIALARPRARRRPPRPAAAPRAAAGFAGAIRGRGDPKRTRLLAWSFPHSLSCRLPASV